MVQISRRSTASNPMSYGIFMPAARSSFASRVKDPATFALVGCTVAPGFNFEDFELAKRAELQETYPQHSALIEQLTRS